MLIVIYKIRFILHRPRPLVYTVNQAQQNALVGKTGIGFSCMNLLSHFFHEQARVSDGTVILFLALV